MDRETAMACVSALAIFFAASWSISLVCGTLVERYGLRVNYSRKICHFITIGLPWVLQQAFSLHQNLTVVVLAAVVTPLNLALYVGPIRRRFAIVRTMFKSFDRPEDRPHTLAWLATQYAGVYAAYLLVYPVLLSRGVAEWMSIAIIVNVVGDGLAEPVGVAFGRHAYSCTALFSRRRYERTLEGSACVFLSALISIVVCRDAFGETQWLLALLIVPISAAVAEAVSPHTWDAPFLFLVIGGELALLSFV